MGGGRTLAWAGCVGKARERALELCPLGVGNGIMGYGGVIGPHPEDGRVHALDSLQHEVGQLNVTFDLAQVLCHF